MAFFRDCCYAAGLALTSPIWGLSLLRTGKWRSDWAGRFGHVNIGARVRAGEADQKKNKVPTVLVHGVSVGEVNAIRQMVEQLSQTPADGDSAGIDINVVIASTTNTGFARATTLFGGDHDVVRYPFDFTRSVRRFLDAVQPDVMVLVELELWPTMLEECERRNIPVIVVNGRLSERSFKRYFKFKSLFKSTFGKLASAWVQTEDYARRFIAMGTPEDRVVVADSMKWDNANQIEPDQVEGVDELVTAMGIDRSKPIVVLGSTGSKTNGQASEEHQLCEALTQGCDDDIQFVVVPRKPERFDHVAEVMKFFAGAQGVVRRTAHQDGDARTIDGARLFLLDTMGELGKAYALADVAIVGRSFVDLYGSDPLEPISMGKPTIIGPRYGDFEDMVNSLKKGGGIEVCSDVNALASAVGRLLGNENAAETMAQNGCNVIAQRQGATSMQVEAIRTLVEGLS